MGKTELTNWLAQQVGVARCTVRQLLNRADPRELLGSVEILVIDALDEAVARSEGDAVDQVLRALGALGYPRFILTCRVADWRSATGLAAIGEQYPVKPLELRLQPFSLEDARAFLAERLGSEQAESLVTLYQSRNLADLLGNPQTLTMLADVAAREETPASIGALFGRYAELTWCEHSDQHPDSVLEARGREAVLNALGAMFAALLLTGSEAISRAPRTKLGTGDLALADVAALPSADALGDALRSRLVAAAGSDRFSWPHKRIAEFLAARWLARRADTPRKRRRLLALFHDRGLVPASLRGLHAWLVWHNSDLAVDVISADPMGIIEYGDADALSELQGRALLAALEKLAVDDPWFLERGDHPAQGLIQSATIEQIRGLITAPEAPIRLRLLLLEQLVGSPHSPAFQEELRALILDPAVAYILRREAVKALVHVKSVSDWPATVEQLRRQGGEDSLRLGLKIADQIGYEQFNDVLLAQLLVGLALIDHNTVGLFWRVASNLPDERLDGILDHISTAAAALGDKDPVTRDYELTGLAYAFIARRVALGEVVPKRLWSWLKPFGDRTSYQRDGQEQLAKLLSNNGELRRGVQQHVLFGSHDDKSVYMRGWELTGHSPGLFVTPEDVCWHLDQFGSRNDANEASIERWRDLVQLARHNANEGKAVREAALAFATGQPELADWLDELPKPRVYDWQIKQEERQKKAEAERERRWADDRTQFGTRLDSMRAGAFRWLTNPAKAYLKLFHHIDSNLAAHERVEHWLGPEIAAAAHEGFEAFLQLGPPWPSATQIVASHVESKGWNAAPILVSALAERLRAGVNFTDLSDERLMAGLFALQSGAYETHAGIEGLKAALEAELKARGCHETALRAWIEPQLKARREHVSDLYPLLRSEGLSDLANKLAAEWLKRFPELSAGVEFELVDCLIRSDRRDDLRHLAASKLCSGGLDDERRRSWEAVALWLDFETTCVTFDAADPETELLWHLRGRLGGGRWAGEGGNPTPLTAEQLAWIVLRFRLHWPSAYRPSGEGNGSNNAWDAADFLRSLMARLGSDISDTAIRLMAELRDAPEDGYTEYLRNVSAEQRRKRVEEAYCPSTLGEITAKLRDEAPHTAADLQSVVMEELAVLARRLAPGGDNANPITGFFSPTRPRGEEACRDHLLTLLRGQLPFSITAEPEGQAADGKANDIACALGPNLMVPIEIKGQWHAELWKAADTQLDRLYASDWRAERRGIYLVLWFGDSGKKLKAPPRGTPRPNTPDALRSALIAHSQAAQAGSVEIVILDLSR